MHSLHEHLYKGTATPFNTGFTDRFIWKEKDGLCARLPSWLQKVLAALPLELTTAMANAVLIHGPNDTKSTSSVP